MSDADAPLTECQAQTMAYVDDELSSGERAEFEQRMAKDPDLAAEVAGYQSLIHMTNAMAILEPGDHEVRRFWAHFYNRSEWRIGWFFLVLGTLILAGYGLFFVLSSSQVHWLIKAALLSATCGGSLLLWSAVRLRMRTARFDRYRGVLR